MLAIVNIKVEKRGRRCSKVLKQIAPAKRKRRKKKENNKNDTEVTTRSKITFSGSFVFNWDKSGEKIYRIVSRFMIFFSEMRLTTEHRTVYPRDHTCFCFVFRPQFGWCEPHADPLMGT